MSGNKNAVEMHGCIVCARVFNLLAVYTPDGRLADNAVTSAKIADETVGGVDITDGGVGTADLADGSR